MNVGSIALTAVHGRQKVAHALSEAYGAEVDRWRVTVCRRPERRDGDADVVVVVVVVVVIIVVDVVAGLLLDALDWGVFGG